MEELIKAMSWILLEIGSVIAICCCIRRYYADSSLCYLTDFKKSNQIFTAIFVIGFLVGMYLVYILAKTWFPTVAVMGIAYVVYIRRSHIWHH